jgi:hypothetical protein
VRSVAADIRTYQRVARSAGGAAAATGLEVLPDAAPSANAGRQYGLKGPALPAEVLYSFPPGLPAGLAEGLAGCCAPHGVRPELLERTPSMSALNEVVYGQAYASHDDQSFVFLMRVSAWEGPSS